MYRRPEHINGFPDVAVRADSNGTPEGSTVAILFLYAAVRVFSTVTPAVRVQFNSGPHGGWVMNSITTGNANTAKPAYETHLSDRHEETTHDATTTRPFTVARTSPATTVGDILAHYIHSSGHRLPLPSSPGAHRHGDLGMVGDEPCHPGQPQHALACLRDSPHRVGQVGHLGHQLPPPSDDRADVKTAGRGIAATSPPECSTTGKTPDPGIKKST